MQSFNLLGHVEHTVTTGVYRVESPCGNSSWSSALHMPRSILLARRTGVEFKDNLNHSCIHGSMIFLWREEGEASEQWMLWSGATPLTPQPRPFNLRSHSMQIPTPNPRREGTTQEEGGGELPIQYGHNFRNMRNGTVLSGPDHREARVRPQATYSTSPLTHILTYDPSKLKNHYGLRSEFSDINLETWPSNLRHVVTLSRLKRNC
jgi:hypothetical protein